MQDAEDDDSAQVGLQGREQLVCGFFVFSLEQMIVGVASWWHGHLLGWNARALAAQLVHAQVVGHGIEPG